jgi:hypothetical protein
MPLLTTTRSRLLVVVLAGFSSLAIGQAQFAGKWQTKKSSTTGKHSITVNIVMNEGKASGAVVLVNPDASKIEQAIFDVELHNDTLEFETKDRDTTFHWRLTLEKGDRRGRLHGSIGEMLIDEKVVKNR